MTILSRALFALVIASDSALAAGPSNLLVNGGFESPAISGDQQFDAPSSAIAGWQLTAGSVDLVASGSILGTAHSGLQMLDINGLSAGAIKQSFATVPGNTYRVELFYSNNPNPASALPSYSAVVSVVGNSQLLQASLTHAGATETEMNWQMFARAFVADSTMTILKLQSSQAGFNGIYFDSVSVIPEPNSLVLIGVAAGCVFIRRSKSPRRHQRRI